MCSWFGNLPRAAYAVVGLLLCSTTVFAVDDPVQKELEIARLRYEEKMADVRAQVVESIEGVLAQVRRAAANDALQRIEQLEQELSTFQLAGEWPPSLKGDSLKRRAQGAKKALANAYKDAYRQYIRSGSEDNALRMQREREHLLAEDDIVPWGPNALAANPEPQRAASSQFVVQELGEMAADRYRLEIMAQRAEGHGSLYVSVPLPGGDRACYESNSESDQHRILLTVRSSMVSQDLNVVMCDSVAPPGGIGASDLAIWASNAVYTITSVKVKRVVDSEPEGEEPKRRAVQQPPPAKPDPFAVGNRWQGFWGGNGCDIDVKSRNGNGVTLRIVRGNKAVFEIDGLMRNDEFLVGRVRMTRVPPGGAMRFFIFQQGSAYVKNGSLFVAIQTRNHIAGKRNEPFPIQISAAAPVP